MDTQIHEMLDYAKRNDSWDEVYAILNQELKRGNNIVNKIPEGRDYSALHHAACMDNLVAVKKLINEYGAKTSLKSRKTKLLPIEVAGTVEKWRRGGIMKVQPYLEELSRQEGSSGSGPTAPPAPAPSEPAAPEPALAPEPQPQPEPEPEPAEPEPAPAESKTTKWQKKDYMPWSPAWKDPGELRKKIGKIQEKLDALHRKGSMDPDISKLLTEKQELIRILKMKESYTGGLQGGGLSKKKRKKKTKITKRTKRKNNKRTKRTKRTKRNRRTKRT